MKLGDSYLLQSRGLLGADANAATGHQREEGPLRAALRGCDQVLLPLTFVPVGL